MVDHNNTSAKIFKNRVLISLLLIAPIAIIAKGGVLALALVFVMGGIMVWEVLTVAKVDLLRMLATLVLVLAPSGVLLGLGSFEIVGVALFVGGVGLYLLLQSWLLALLLIAVMLTAISSIGLLITPQQQWLLLAIIIIAAADSAAYVIGKKFGKAKIAPTISPGKTWLGAIAGLTAGAIAGIITGWGGMGLPLLTTAIMGLVVADLSIGGDLFESYFKRRYGIKDMSGILQGHGGLLDRCDGYLFALPCVYLAVLLGWLNGS